MKKWIALLLVLTMVLSLAACGDKEEKKPDSIKHVATGSTAEEKPEKPQKPEKPEKPEKPAKPAQMSIEEQIVVDNDQVTVKISDVYLDDYGDLAVKCFCENKSEDTTYRFSVRRGSINGIDMLPLFAPELEPGERSNEEVTFWVDELAEQGVTEFTDIWLSFYVYDSNDYMADPVAEVDTHVYPYGEKNATVYVRKDRPGDVVLLDNKYCKIVALGTEMDDFMGYGVKLYMENRTDSTIMVSIEDALVNGDMIDPFYANSVSANACCFDTAFWSLEDLEQNDISEVEEIEMILNGYNDDDWDVPDYFDERVTYNP